MSVRTVHALPLLPIFVMAISGNMHRFDDAICSEDGDPGMREAWELEAGKSDSGPTSALIPWTKFSGATWSLLSLAPNLPSQLFIPTVPDVVPIGILSFVSLFLKVSSWYHQPVKFSLYYQNRGP